MIHFTVNLLRAYPQIVVFLSLAIGYALGKIKYRGFSMGATTCVLLVAIVLGQVGVEVSDLMKNIFFALFMFCIGYKVGPQFFGSLKKDGLSYIWLSLVVAVIGLGSTILLGKLLHFNPGTTAGLFAGSVTQSAALGTAEGAIAQLSITDVLKSALNTNVAVAYAITYIFGTAGGILFFKFAPMLLGINLKDESKKLEEKMSGGSGIENKPELFSWTKQLDIRAYRVSNQNIVGKKTVEVENLFPGRVAIDKIKRTGQIMETKPDTIIQLDDIIVITGGPKWIIKASELIGTEVDVTEVTDIIGEIMEICLLNKDFAGKTLGELGKNKAAHGIFLKKITRQGHEIPVTRDTVLNKCDVLQVVGAKEDVERAVKLIGYPERPTAITDLVMVGIGCVAGTLIGLLSVKLGGIPVTLGVGGGVLVAGLIFGWLRSVHPTFGQIPTAGEWILQDLGLNIFVACIGISAGPKAVQAFQSNGMSVFLAGIAVCLLPLIFGLFFGKIILKMNPVLLLGGLAGARVLTAALNTLQEDADSTAPALGYAVPYAFGNVLLAICGNLIINIM